MTGRVLQLLVVGALAVSCGGVDQEPAVERAEEVTARAKVSEVVVDVRTAGSGPVCYSVSLPAVGSETGEACRDFDNSAPIVLVSSDPVESGAAGSSWVNVFLAADGVTVETAEQDGEQLRLGQQNRVVAVVGSFALATATRTELTYRIGARVGSCVFDADGSRCEAR